MRRITDDQLEWFPEGFLHKMIKKAKTHPNTWRSGQIRAVFFPACVGERDARNAGIPHVPSPRWPPLGQSEPLRGGSRVGYPKK